MNAFLCALSLSLVPSDPSPPTSLADKNADLERKVAELERKVNELRLAELERKVADLSAPQSGGQPRVQVVLPPPLAPVVVAPAVTTVSIQVNQGGGYGGYGVGGYYNGGYGYAAPRYGYGYGTQTARPVHSLPVTTRQPNVGHATHHRR